MVVNFTKRPYAKFFVNVFPIGQLENLKQELTLEPLQVNNKKANQPVNKRGGCKNILIDLSLKKIHEWSVNT